MPIEPFYLIVTDRDNKVFNIVGPMSDDTSFNEKVLKCQEQGRHVNCHSANQQLSREALIQRVSIELNLEYTDVSIL
jgi:hypothetical protein